MSSNNYHSSSSVADQVGLEFPDRPPPQMDHERLTFVEASIPALKPALEAHRDALNSLTSVIPMSTNVMTSITNASDNIGNAAQQMTVLIEQLRLTLLQIPVVQPFVNKIIDAAVLLYDVFVAIFQQVWAAIPSLIIRIMQLFGIAQTIVNAFIRDLLKSFPPLQPTAGERRLDVQGYAHDFYKSMLGILITGQKPTIDQLRYVNEYSKFRHTVLNEVKDMGKFVAQLLTALPDDVQLWLAYIMPTKWWLSVFHPGSDMYNWIEAVNEMVSHNYTVRAAFQPEVQRRILALHQQGQALLRDCAARGPKYSLIFNLLNSTFKRIDELYHIVDMASFHTTSRPVPFVVYLYGDTGQGKSFLSTALPSILTGLAADEPNLSYARNPAMKHWDGYTGQYAVVYDDYGAVRTANADPGENAELMSIVSNDQYRLPMAAVNEKKEIFRSQIVIMSSNIAYNRPNEIQCHEALWRRRHAFYEVRVKDAYRLPGHTAVDVNRIPPDFSHWTFRKMDPTHENNERGPAIEFDQFVDELMQTYETHVRDQIRARQAHERITQSAVARARDRVEAQLLQVQPERILQVQGKLADQWKALMETAPLSVQQDGRAAEVYAELLAEDAKAIATAPAWVKALIATVSIVGSMGALALLMNWLTRPKKEKETKYEFEQLARFAASPRVQKMDVEGRWTPLFEMMKNATPEMAEIFNKALEDVPEFQDLTDSEVEATIMRTLALPRVRKFCDENKLSQFFVKRKHVEGNLRREISRLWHMLDSPRVKALDVEGRWRPLYEKISAAQPWMIDIFETAMDNEPSFANMTDEEVEEAIARALRSKQIQKYLLAEGAYSGMPGKTKPIAARTLRVEGSVDSNAMQIVHERIAGSLVRMKTPYIDTIGVAIFGRTMLLPYHVFFKIDGSVIETGTPITLQWNDLDYPMYFEPEMLVQIAKDAVCYQCPASVPLTKDISHLFITNNDLDFSKKFPGVLVTMTDKNLPMLQFTESPVTGTSEKSYGIYDQSIAAFAPRNMPSAAYDPATTVIFERGTAWSYTAQTRFGMCGSPLVALDKYMMRKIIGIHILGGSDGRAVALPVTQEQIEKAKRHFGVNMAHVPIDHVSDRNYLGAQLKVQGHFTPIGTQHPPIFANETTKIIPSPLHGKVMPVKTAPSVMSRFDPRNVFGRDPMEQGINKYGDPAPSVDMRALRRVRQHIGAMFASYNPNCGRRVLTEEEAINGVDGCEFIDPINMSTSAGYPYIHAPRLQGQTGKTHVISGDQAQRTLAVSSPLLRNMLDDRWLKAMAGERVPSMWIDTLKDERRSITRIIEGKTRVFTIPPLCFTIVARRLFSAFNETFYKTRLATFSAVGIDPASMEWTALYRKLTNVSTTGFAGDYSGWDGNISAEFMMATCEMINQWYDDEPEFQTARKVIFEELIHTMQCAKDLIYLTHHGNPSGNPFTSILNTIVNAMYFRYCWLQLAPQEMQALPYYDQNVVDVEYGDDSIVSATDQALIFFNPTNIQIEMAKLGMTFTDASKSGPAALKHVKDLTFLKRGFRQDELGAWHPLMDLQTVGELFNWIRETRAMTKDESMITNVNDALGFVYHYGKKSFEEMRKKVLVALQPLDHPKVLDYEYFHSRFWKAHDYEFRLDVQGDAKTSNEKDDIRSEINTKGILSIAQRATEMSAPVANPLISNTLGKGGIGDPQWTIPQMANRRVWLGTYQWTTAQAFKNTIIHYQCPTDIIVNYLQSAPFERFLYWRGSLKFHIHINGTRFHAGRLMAYFVPFTRYLMIQDWHETNPAAAFCLKPVFIDPASNPEAILETPYYNPKSYISINTTYDSNMDFTGTFMLQVLVPLTAATGSPTTVNVTIWVEVGNDSEYHVPLHSASPSRAYNAEHRRQMEKRYDVQGGTQSVTNNITQYGNMDSATIPQSLTNDDFSGMASGNDLSIPMPMDRAGRTWNPFNIIRKFVQNYTNSIGSEMVTRLDLNPSNLNEAMRVHFSTNTDEMLFRELTTIPTWVANIPWAASDPIGHSLMSGFIGPMSTFFVPGTSNQRINTVGQRVECTLWEYMSMRHAFWRGSIHMRFDIVATQFHTGRLILSLNYGATPDAEVGLRDATSQYAIEWEVNNEKRTFEFTIPWTVATPWLKVCRGPLSPDDVKPTAAAWWANYFMGSWNLRVENPLVTTDAAPPNATIVFSMCGGPDFDLYYPTNENQTWIPAFIGQTGPPPLERRLDVQGDVKNEKSDGSGGGEDAAAIPPLENSIRVDAVKIAPPGHQDAGLRDLQFGHQSAIRSVKDEARRYVLKQSQAMVFYQVPEDIATPTNDTPVGITSSSTGPSRVVTAYEFVEVKPFQSKMSGTLAPHNYIAMEYNCPMARYGLMYRFWRGSIRYKVFFGQLLGGVGMTTRLTPQYNTVVYIPHAQFTTPGAVPAAARPNWADIALGYSRAFTVGQTIAGMGALTNYGGVLFASDASQNAIVPYCEVEVPFTTRFNVLPTQTAITDTLDSPDMTMSGVLLIASTYMVTEAEFNQLSAPADFSIWYMSYMYSFGDDFRYGTLLGVPNIFQESSASRRWPDAWASATPALNHKQQQKRIEMKSAAGADVPLEVCHCKRDPDVHIKDMRCKSGAYERRFDVQGDFVYALSRNDIRYPVEKESASRFVPDYGVANICHMMTKTEFDVANRIHFNMIVNREKKNSEVIQNLCLSQGLVIKMEWHKAVSQFLVDWYFNDFRVLRGLFWINAIERYVGYVMDIDKIHKSLVDDIWQTVRHYVFAGRDIFNPKDKEGMRGVSMIWPELGPDAPIEQMVADEVHKLRIDECPPEMRLDIQGDTEPKYRKRVQPTAYAISQVILDLDERSHEPARNYRMALAELTQKVMTAICEVKFMSTGSPHNPIFSAEMLFLVDCGVFNEQKATAASERKADANEDAAKQLFLTLVQIAKDQTEVEDSKPRFGYNDYGHLPDIFWKEEEIHNETEGVFAFCAAFEGMASQEELCRFYEEILQPDCAMLVHFKRDDWFVDVLRNMGYTCKITVESTRDKGIGLRKVTVMLRKIKKMDEDIMVKLHTNKQMFPPVGVDFALGEVTEIAIRSAIMEMLARERPNWASFRGACVVEGDKI